MLFEFENRIAGFIKTNGLFESAGKILLAVSGGGDSTALMHRLLLWLWRTPRKPPGEPEAQTEKGPLLEEIPPVQTHPKPLNESRSL